MANLRNYGHVRGRATSYAQDPAHRMLGAVFGPRGAGNGSREAHFESVLKVLGAPGEGMLRTALPKGGNLTRRHMEVQRWPGY